MSDLPKFNPGDIVAAELARHRYLAVQKLTEAGYKAEVVSDVREWYTDNYVKVTLL